MYTQYKNLIRFNAAQEFNISMKDVQYRIGALLILCTLNKFLFFRSSQKLRLGAWHRVSFKRVFKRGELSVDGGAVTTGESQVGL